MENKLENLKRTILGIETGHLDLIDIKEKHNKDLIWTISIKVSSKKEVDEFKKDCYTIK